MPASNDHDDLSLLRRFVDSQDEAAFRVLVDRHLPRVYAVALRRTGDHHRAQDVAQEVFSSLARRAGKLRPGTVLVAWLHRVATTESAEALRREYRHRRTMSAYTNQVRTDDDNAPAPESFAVLDEAINALPEADRSAILLRFTAGQRFREVGAALGKSEEAARKQVSRAVEKLGVMLRRKGIAVSTGTLIATLSLPAFTQGAAPAGLAATIASGATAAAAGNLPLPLQLLHLMSQAKLKIALVTAPLLLVGTASFVAGRHQAADFARSLSQATPPPAARPVIAAVAEELPPSDARVRSILGRAAAIFRESDSVVLAYYEGLLVLHELGAADIPAALEFLESADTGETLRRRMTPIILGIWAGSDGAAAMAYAEAHVASDGFAASCDHILGPWARRDAESAYRWYGERRDSGDLDMNLRSFHRLPAPVFEGWAEADPEAALAVLADVPVEDERAAIDGISRARARSLDPAPLLASIGQMPPGPIKRKVVTEVAKSWAREEPQLAAAWLDTISELPPRDRLFGKIEVAEEWARNDRGALPKISAWLLAGTPAEFHSRIIEALAKDSQPD